SGLYYYRARYYQPNLGRFISEDPIRLSGGINSYAYVNGNPAALVDPYGLWAGIDDAVFMLGGALVGVGGQGISDLISGDLSGWEKYTGAAAGGALGGRRCSIPETQFLQVQSEELPLMRLRRDLKCLLENARVLIGVLSLRIVVLVR
ncbi:hypothetical protein CEK64_12140, partial [Xanthomonas sontii]|uniref:RHS repeat-associated core domain-containing protein n=1 Tax=Xanthomonas sontii TaxID=2650745 RepID=UPI00123E3E75